MHLQSPGESIVINKIEDLLFIELKDNSFQETVYSIQTDSEKVVRKGSFKGDMIQLCLSHLASGCYKLFVSSANRTLTFPFEKQNLQVAGMR